MTVRDVLRDTAGGVVGYITHGGVSGIKKGVQQARNIDRMLAPVRQSIEEYDLFGRGES